jgi:hypothetical protein
MLSVDEKTQVQAVSRTQPMLPMRRRLPRRQTHDDKRHGTVSLFAAVLAHSSAGIVSGG